MCSKLECGRGDVVWWEWEVWEMGGSGLEEGWELKKERRKTKKREGGQTS